MNRAEMGAFIQAFSEKLLHLNATKGSEYSGDDDALRNFKNGGRDLSLPPETVWWVYAKKHWDAITTHCADQTAGNAGRQLSEPMEGRFLDLALYCILGAAIESERPRVERTGQGSVEDPLAEWRKREVLEKEICAGYEKYRASTQLIPHISYSEYKKRWLNDSAALEKSKMLDKHPAQPGPEPAPVIFPPAKGFFCLRCDNKHGLPEWQRLYIDGQEVTYTQWCQRGGVPTVGY